MSYRCRGKPCDWSVDRVAEPALWKEDQASVLVRCDSASRVGQSIARSIGRLCLAWWSAGGRGYQPRTEHICLSRERVGGEVLLCFFKAEQCKFSDIYGLYRGARTCLLAGTGGRSPTAML